MTHFELKPIGRVESPLTDRNAAPKQGFEGAPRTSLVMQHEFAAGLKDLKPGEALLVLTWLDRADRGVLQTRPRDDPDNPMTGVFSTRSPDRPNPIGLHRVRVVAIFGERIEVDDLEALDGTPIVDLKPVLEQAWER